MAVIFSQLSRLLTQREPSFQSWRKPAAIMVLLARTPILSVLLIHRPDTLTHHAGQIACPGGSFDPILDQTLWDTARRETQEEVGIAVCRSSFTGFLDPVYISVTGFTVIPAVSLLPAQAAVIPHLGEVQSYCWVSIEELRQVKRMGTLRADGVSYRFPEFPLPWGRVWGATARVMEQLLQVLDGDGEGAAREDS